MIESRPAGVRFAVRVTPRASRDETTGWGPDGALKVRLAAPPVDGEANAALTAWLAGLAGVRKGAVKLVRGATGRSKIVEIEGITAAALTAAIEKALKPR